MKKFARFLSMSSVLMLFLVPINTFAIENDYKDSKESVTYQENDELQESKLKTEVKVTQQSTYSILIPKQIILNGIKGEKNDADYIITVKGNISSDEIVTVKPDDYFVLTNTKNNKKISAIVTQESTKFVIDKTKDKHYKNNQDYSQLGTIKGNVEAFELTEGYWDGEFKFYINLSISDF